MIESDGLVANEITTKSAIKDEGFESCVSEVIKRIRSPKPHDGAVKVKYPFLILPEHMGQSK